MRLKDNNLWFGTSNLRFIDQMEIFQLQKSVGKTYVD